MDHHVGGGGDAGVAESDGVGDQLARAGDGRENRLCHRHIGHLLQFKRADVHGCARKALETVAALIKVAKGRIAVVAAVDGRAAAEQRMRGGRSAVVLERADLRINGRGVVAYQIAVDAVGKAEAVAGVADQVVPPAGEGTGDVGGLGAGAGAVAVAGDDGVVDRGVAARIGQPAAIAKILIGHIGHVVGDGDIVEFEGAHRQVKTTAVFNGLVAADCRIFHCQEDQAAVCRNANTATAEFGPVVGNGAFDDRGIHVTAARIQVETAAFLGAVAKNLALDDRDCPRKACRADVDAAAVAVRRVGVDSAVAQGHSAAAGNRAAVIALRIAIVEGQPGEGDTVVDGDVEDAAAAVAVEGDGHAAGDGQRLGDHQFTACEDNALPRQSGIKADFAAHTQIGNRLAQRPRAAVGIAGDGDGIAASLGLDIVQREEAQRHQHKRQQQHAKSALYQG